jgi:hypothetical protein
VNINELIGKRIAFKSFQFGMRRCEGVIKGGFVGKIDLMYGSPSTDIPPFFFIVAFPDPEKQGSTLLDGIGFHQSIELLPD